MEIEQKIQQLEEILADDPNDSLGFFMLGKLYLDADRAEKAAEALERCLELNPKHSAAYRFCGDAYRKADKLDEAREVYSRGIVVANENGDLQTVKEVEAFLRKLGE